MTTNKKEQGRTPPNAQSKWTEIVMFSLPQITYKMAKVKRVCLEKYNKPPKPKK